MKKTKWVVSILATATALACGADPGGYTAQGDVLGSDAPLPDELALEETAQQEQELQASATDDPNNVAWVSERDMSSAQFGTNFTKWKDAGYRMLSINVDAGKYAAVWRKNDGKEWAEYRDMTSDQYGAKWQELKDKGMRPLDIEAYQIGGALRFAGIWVKQGDGLAWASYRNLTSEQFSTYFEQYKGTHIPTNVDAYQVGNEWRYAVIWVENKDKLGWYLYRNLTADDYAAKWQSLKDDGYRVVDFESYQTANGQRYSAIWHKNSNGRGWASLREMTELQYANHWRKYRDLGYRVVDFERYTTASGTRYGVVWRRNGDLLAYANRNAVDTAIKDYVADTNLPGVSVTIAQDGNIVFRRGYGYADVGAGKEAHSETVYDAASVSKPIGTTLLMRLRQADTAAYNLGSTTRSYLGNAMPSHHKHTLRQLLNHTGCVHHYSNSVEANDGDDSTNPATIDEVQYNSQLTASAEFWSDKLICTPPSTGNNYSTHAFTFVGAVIEDVSGRTLPTLIQDELNTPFGLSSLRVKYPLASNYERSALYTLQDTSEMPDPTTNKNVAISQDNTTWKTLGGGLELSAYDLARFGMGVRNASIVNAAARDLMWTTTVGDFGLGWVVKNSFVEHNGSAAGARSHLRVYTGADNVVIAVMSNRRNHSTNGLDINDLVNEIKAAM